MTEAMSKTDETGVEGAAATRDAPAAAAEAPPAAAEAPAEAPADAAPALDPQEAQIIALTAERDELRDRLLRSLADAENSRKRAERDRRDAETYAVTRLARDLLEVHDNLGRALALIDESHRAAMGSLIEGLELTQKELLAVFARHRIEKISPAAGERFDANRHQAMFEVPLPGAEPGSIVQVIAEGFMIADRLLRPAQVAVAGKAPAAA
jgi:molecular chaperone GrpE